MLLILTMFLSFFGTLALRQYALAKNVVDTPNSRSSHTVPTPRGGGVAIVFAYLAALIFWQFYVGFASGLFWSLLVGGGLIAVVGFWDDHASLPARFRFAFHVLAAGLAMFWLEGWPQLDLGGVVLHWGYLGYLCGALLLAWAINFYNFMDGIDGLAASQSVFVSGAGGLLMYLTGGDGMPLWLLAAASTGFLLLNWPPARIFMGDAGSGFLGYALAVHALHATTTGQTTLWPWLILLAVFVVDATLALLRRAARGIRITDAHRTHAYQWASRRVGAHKPVTLAILLINLLVLLPVALCALVWPSLAMIFCLVCYAVLAVFAWCSNSGVPECECMKNSAVLEKKAH